MSDVERLIDRLADDATPVRPLASPLRRALRWLLAAIAVLVLIALQRGIKPGALAVLHTPDGLLAWLASIATGVLAAYATFAVSVPGRDRRWAWLPVPAFVLWIASVGGGCLADVARIGAAALAPEQHAYDCAVAITLTGVPLGLVMLLMVRHAAAVRPVATTWLAGLSVAALGSAGVSLYHGGESAAMVLLWHVGATIAFAGVAALCGRPLLGWIGYARRG